MAPRGPQGGNGFALGVAVFQVWFVRDGIGRNPFRFPLGIAGGSFPISHPLPAPLGHAFGAGRVGWGCRGQPGTLRDPF